MSRNLTHGEPNLFTPNQDLKTELKNTNVVITCYDRNGNEVKRVTSTDDGTVADNEPGTTGEEDGTTDGKTDGEGTSEGSSSSSGSNENQNPSGGGENQGGDNTGSTPGGGGFDSGD